MKIITLIEDTKINDNLTEEFGLSMYIESNGKNILFDTGSSIQL
jgi:metal-dependent hydrolase (beta-lactamase superfamily II)